MHDTTLALPARPRAPLRARVRAWLIGLSMLCCSHADASDPVAASVDFARAARPASALLIQLIDACEPWLRDLPPLQRDALYLQATLQTALGAPLDAERSWERLYAQAAQGGDQRTQLAALHAQGELHTLDGSYRELHALGVRMLGLAEQANAPAYTAIAYNLLGTAARRHGRLVEAADYHQRALTLRRKLDDRAGEAESLANLGTTRRDQGMFVRALALQHDALQIRLRQPDRAHLDIAYRNLALLYRELADTDQARLHFQKALEAARMRPIPASLASVLGSYAVFLNDIGEYAEARLHASQALSMDQSLGNRAYVALDRLQLGRALNGLGRHAEAIPPLQAALQAGRETAQTEVIAGALLTLARTDLAGNAVQVANTRVEEAINLLEDARMMPLLTDAWHLRERITTRLGDQAGALHALRKYTRLREDLVGTRSAQRIAALKSLYQRQHYDERIELLTRDNAENLARARQHRRTRDLVIALALSLIALLAVIWNRYRATYRLNRELAHKHREVESARHALEEVNGTLREQSRKLYRLATRDPLTGVCNRRHMLQKLERHIGRGRDVSVLLIDFDHFKQINDRLGHLFGDQVLCTGTHSVLEHLGPGQLIGRFGGEEFLVALFDLSADESARIAETLRQHMTRAMAQVNPEAQNPITVSIGIATLSECEPRTLKALLGAADQAMYQAKAHGRNRIFRQQSI
ncbi:diguanylate cyclase [Oleiagrimonas sp. MCCC 1A03011]|uniref:diguanylate cyclase n=1 Tax=Oleiagrimonas sp. MCCC 1A03011 TaxID=1926883 RepID=UPI000DC28247|nr:diguanylate cyclase [Oleiagrimonas sp. MCCC 1A03011]RAP59191.1 hypothetical protein BTJ49_00410 [Oleiagrimonas sp. MCCC 1A03011]